MRNGVEKVKGGEMVEERGGSVAGPRAGLTPLPPLRKGGGGAHGRDVDLVVAIPVS